MANYAGKRMYPNAPGLSPVLDLCIVSRLSWFKSVSLGRSTKPKANRSRGMNRRIDKPII